ncbi:MULTISPECIES: TetR/AcrR family transcriptional regulator [Streptomyces]|uniref:AcrR family transcriptional regulator n=1 Tax=Streptomyces nymphaeiformis TaxID=2663842 RepID=A0A7W7TWN9_9ACTN|nr:TetR/AcrR family transcriptional regulator [Streptomyces nymphaeiformis]MBB4980737.1 AcrR family transcriptional regulator [Streptomyces nymphaeiformis]
MVAEGAGTTRAQIVDAANRLFYVKGFEHTSFAAIAETVGISRGNFYHHFKSKDEILGAVIEARLQSTRAMLAEWDRDEPGPAERVRRFVEIVIANGADIQDFGCPVGTLTNELAKLGHPARPQAVAVFDLFRTWLRAQFEELGLAVEADDLAMHVLAFSQGAATLSNAFHDGEFVRREVDRLHAWLDERLAHGRPIAGSAH